MACVAGAAYPVGSTPKPEGFVGLHVVTSGAHIGLVGWIDCYMDYGLMIALQVNSLRRQITCIYGWLAQFSDVDVLGSAYLRQQ